MDKFERIVFLTAKMCDRIAQFALVVMMAIFFGNIFGRFFKCPIVGSMDIVSMAGGILVSFSIAYCAVQKGHVALTLVVDRLPQWVQIIIESITGIISTILFMVLAVYCGVWGTQVWQSHKLLGVIRLPVFPFIYVLGFGSFLLAFVLLVDLCKLIRKGIRK